MLEGWTQGHSRAISCGYSKSVQVFSPSPQFIWNLCANGAENTVLWYKIKMLLFHRKGCPRWVSAQLKMGSLDVTYYLSSRLLQVWTLVSRSWEGLRNTSVTNNYRNFSPTFATPWGLGHAPSGARGRAAPGGYYSQVSQTPSRCHLPIAITVVTRLCPNVAMDMGCDLPELFCPVSGTDSSVS